MCKLLRSSRTRGGGNELGLLHVELGALAGDGLALSSNLLTLASDLRERRTKCQYVHGPWASKLARYNPRSRWNSHLLLNLRHALEIELLLLPSRLHDDTRAPGGALGAAARGRPQLGDLNRREHGGEVDPARLDLRCGARGVRLQRKIAGRTPTFTSPGLLLPNWLASSGRMAGGRLGRTGWPPPSTPPAARSSGGSCWCLTIVNC